MLRRYSRSHGNGNSVASSSVDATVVSKPPGMEAYEKHVKEMSKLLEESQKKIDQVVTESIKLHIGSLGHRLCSW